MDRRIHIDLSVTPYRPLGWAEGLTDDLDVTGVAHFKVIITCPFTVELRPYPACGLYTLLSADVSASKPPPRRRLRPCKECSRAVRRRKDCTPQALLGGYAMPDEPVLPPSYPVRKGRWYLAVLKDRSKEEIIPVLSPLDGDVLSLRHALVADYPDLVAVRRCDAARRKLPQVATSAFDQQGPQP